MLVAPNYCSSGHPRSWSVGLCGSRALCDALRLLSLGFAEHKQLLKNAQMELKKSKRKDYYKILGVDKNASEDEIKKAYRKRALMHHPGIQVFSEHALLLRFSCTAACNHHWELGIKGRGNAWADVTPGRLKCLLW